VDAACRRGPDCYYAAPKEGYEAWSNNTILLKGAVDRRRSKTAHQLANAFLSGFYGRKLARIMHDARTAGQQSRQTAAGKRSCVGR
jgi:hypothetical protein